MNIKKVLAVLLSMAMLFTTAVTAIPKINTDKAFVETTAPKRNSSSGTCGENLTWTLDDEGTLTISGTGDMTNYSSSSAVPWYSNRSSIKKVIIENGVTSIGVYAFYYCSSLTDVYYGGSEADWNDISIGNNNASLLNATIHFSYEDGKYIVYVNSTSEFIFDGITVNKLAADLNESSYLLLQDANSLIVDLNGYKWTTSSDSVLIVAGGLCIATIYDTSAVKTGAMISTGNDAVNVSNGELTIENIIVKGGDATGDGIVNGKDIIRIKKQILGGNVVEYTEFADINCDGTVDEKDLDALANML